MEANHVNIQYLYVCVCIRELRSREGYEAVFVPGSVFASEGVTKSLPQKNVDGRVEGPQL